jgi:Pectate lyase superfamily protein
MKSNRSCRLVAAFALVILCLPQMLHAQKTKQTLLSEIPVLCPINQSAGLCTVTNANQIWTDIVNSVMPPAPVTNGNLACFDGTTGLLRDCGSAPPTLGTMAAQNANAVAITGGTITGMANPVNSTDVANKQYVDASASGLNILAQSRLATAAILPNSPTYSNGTAGVGATLTAGSNSTLTVDGTVANLNDVILVQNQASAFQNGIYAVTTAGSGSAAWVLTRATYFNTAALMKVGSYTLINAGATNINKSFVLNSVVTTVGTDALNWVLFSNGASGVASLGGQTGAITCGTGIACSGGSLTFDPTQSYTWSAAQIFNNNTTFNGGSNTFNGTLRPQTTYAGGLPVFDIKSTMNGCTAAVGDNTTDDTAAIQCHINYMHTTYGGGTVYIPPSASCYLVSGGGLIVTGGIWLIGSSIDSTCINVKTDSHDLQFYTGTGGTAGTCPGGGLNGGIDKLSIYGYQNAAATQGAIFIGDNCVANIYNSRSWYGSYGLDTHGTDGTVFNSFICGYTGCVHSSGANWYVRDKFDAVSPGTIPTTYGFVQSTNYPGLSIAENRFVLTDLSVQGATYSLYIDDGANTSVTFFYGSVFDSPIFLNHVRTVEFSGNTLGSTTLTINAGSMAMATNIGLSAITVSGAGGRSCAANINITC